jgi:hypothetical protein
MRIYPSHELKFTLIIKMVILPTAKELKPVESSLDVYGAEIRIPNGLLPTRARAVEKSAFTAAVVS